MINPCYDPKTKTDCPDRHPGCSKDCAEWDNYVRKREVEYQKRKKNTEGLKVDMDIKRKLHREYGRKKHR